MLGSHQKQISLQQLHGECLDWWKEFESGGEENERKIDSQEEKKFEQVFAWKNAFVFFLLID